MPVVFKYRRGTVWWLRYAKRTGLPPRSLGTGDEKLAEQIRLNDEHKVVFGREGIRDMRLRRISFADFVREYLTHKKSRDLRSGTLVNYAKALNRLGASLKRDIAVDMVTLEMLEAHVRWMREKGSRRLRKVEGKLKPCEAPMSKKTVRNEIMILVTAFRWAKKQRYLSTNPMDELELPKPVKYVPRPIHVEQYLALKKAVDDEKYKDVLDFYYLTGIRRADGPILRFSKHVDLEARVLYLPQQKQEDFRQMFISEELLPVIKRLQLRSAGSDRLISMHKNDLSKRFRKYADKAGLPPHITFHSLRHTYGTMLAASGAAPRMVQSLMGHSDPRSTQIYVGAFDDDMRRAIGKLRVPVEGQKN